MLVKANVLADVQQRACRAILEEESWRMRNDVHDAAAAAAAAADVR